MNNTEKFVGFLTEENALEHFENNLIGEANLDQEKFTTISELVEYCDIHTKKLVDMNYIANAFAWEDTDEGVNY